MKDNSYLYGKYTLVNSIPSDIADERILKLKINLKEVLAEHYTSRDYHRVNSICKAIEFWKKLKE